MHIHVCIYEYILYLFNLLFCIWFHWTSLIVMVLVSFNFLEITFLFRAVLSLPHSQWVRVGVAALCHLRPQVLACCADPFLGFQRCLGSNRCCRMIRLFRNTNSPWTPQPTTGGGDAQAHHLVPVCGPLRHHRQLPHYVLERHRHQWWVVGVQRLGVVEQSDHPAAAIRAETALETKERVSAARENLGAEMAKRGNLNSHLPENVVTQRV